MAKKTGATHLLPTKAQWKKWVFPTKLAIILGVLGVLASMLGWFWPQINGDVKRQELQHSDLTNQITTLRAQLEQLTKLTEKILAKVDRNTIANIGGERRDPVLAAQFEVARESGLTVDELKKRLAAENADIRQIIWAIDTHRLAAHAQADDWTRLQREALTKLGNTEYAAAHYSAAIEPYRQALALIDEKKEPLVWCDTAQNLGVALYAQGRYAEAEPLARQVNETRTALQGKEHPNTLASVNNLATLLADKGDYAGAEPLFRRALEAHERTLGKEHPNTLASVNNLAILLSDKGDYAGAEPLFRRALEAQGRTLGKEHPDTLRSVNNLANLLRDKGDYADAEPLYRRAMDLQERTLGKEHPATLASVNNLATLLADKGDYAGAEPLCRRALEAQERTLGKEHPDTLASANNLANLLFKKGDYAGAEPLYRRALEARERTLGKEHPDTIGTAFNFSLLREKQGRMTEALDLAKQAVAGAQKSLPESYPLRQRCEKYLAELQAQIAQAKAKP